MPNTKREDQPACRPIRWWLGACLVLLGLIVVIWTRLQSDWPFQKRNLITYEILIVTVIALLIWWTFLSRAPKRLRLGVTFVLVGLMIVGASLFRLRGMSGDMAPILEFRWAGQASQDATLNRYAGVTLQRSNDATIHRSNELLPPILRPES